MWWFVDHCLHFWQLCCISVRTSTSGYPFDVVKHYFYYFHSCPLFYTNMYALGQGVVCQLELGLLVTPLLSSNLLFIYIYIYIYLISFVKHYFYHCNSCPLFYTNMYAIGQGVVCQLVLGLLVTRVVVKLSIHIYI